MQWLGLKLSQPVRSARTGLLISSNVTIESPGFNNLSVPSQTLYAGNSGTTMRVLSGLSAGQKFKSRFDGDASLRKRPMSRVLAPLEEMGAQIEYEDSGSSAGCAPFSVSGGRLHGREFDLKVASAQVQTALILAGLQADGTTSVKLPNRVRDHTERMLTYIKVPFTTDGAGAVKVTRLQEPVPPFDLVVPGDLSSAAFFMVAAACLPGSDLLLKGTGINPGRTLIIEVLRQMGAEVSLEDTAEVCGEPVANIRVRFNGRLQGGTVSGERVALGIDEIPVLALAGSICDGIFTVTGAGELRHKESDRLTAIVENLRAAGVEVQELDDGFTIHGCASIKGGSPWRTYHDHRLAMTGLVANCIFASPVDIEETESIKISYPGFAEHLRLLTQSGVEQAF
jgi:3-phosphoshikimate 1-carboxyvinyltransferase